jgi:hypothetical protein
MSRTILFCANGCLNEVLPSCLWWKVSDDLAG